MTFVDAAKAFISAKEAEWSNLKHAAQWRNTISTYVEPIIGKVYVRDVDTSHIAKVLEPIWTDQKRNGITPARPNRKHPGLVNCPRLPQGR